MAFLVERDLFVLFCCWWWWLCVAASAWVVLSCCLLRACRFSSLFALGLLCSAVLLPIRCIIGLAHAVGVVCFVILISSTTYYLPPTTYYLLPTTYYYCFCCCCYCYCS